MKYFSFVIPLIALFLTGCFGDGSLSGGGEASILKSLNYGESFDRKAMVSNVSGKPSSLDTSDIGSLVFDPQDPNTMYMGTGGEGLYLSFDAGESWQRTKANQGPSSHIIINPKDRCTLYFLMSTRIIKSIDCARTFTIMLSEPREGVIFTALALDSYNSSIIYAGNDRGDIIQSRNAGVSWSPLYRFSSPIAKILISSHDTRMLYIATEGEGVYASSDRGASFQSWREALSAFQGSSEFVDLIEVPENPQHLILASRFGLLQTFDQGGRFEEIPILTRPEEIPLYALAVNPRDSREIYYTDSANFYRSRDGGATWTPKKLLFSKPAATLLIDPLNPNIIYLGLSQEKK